MADRLDGELLPAVAALQLEVASLRETHNASTADAGVLWVARLHAQHLQIKHNLTKPSLTPFVSPVVTKGSLEELRRTVDAAAADLKVRSIKQH